MQEAGNIEQLQELLARVKDEAVEASRRSVPAISAALAAAIEELSCWLRRVTSLDILLRTEGGGQLAADLQRTICMGDLFARFCSSDAVAQKPATVTAFLLGLVALAAAVPGLALDFEPLLALGVHIDYVLTNASQQHGTKEGEDSLAGLQQLRQAYVRVFSACMAGAEVTDLSGLGLQGSVLEPLLHLTLGELSAACQLAEKQQRCDRVESASFGSSSLNQAERPGSGLQPREDMRAGQAALLLTALFLLAVEPAGQGGVRLQRLIGCGAGLVKALNQLTDVGSKLTRLQLKVLGSTADGLTTLLSLQLAVLIPLRDSRPSKAQESALKDILRQRMQWVEAAAALAKVLHFLADAAAEGIDSVAQQRGLASEVALNVWRGLQNCMIFVEDVYLVRYEPGRPSNGHCIGQPGGFARVSGAVEPLLTLAELLLRLAAKQPALAGLGVGSDFAEGQHGAAKFLLSIAAYITSDLHVASSCDRSGGTHQGQPCQSGERNQSMSSSGSGSGSDSGSSLLPETFLWKVVSLAGTAAKLGRYLPSAWPGPEECSSFASHYLRLLQNMSAMCCTVMALEPHLVGAPGPQRSLTQHLKSTGFLPFLCLPALAQAMGCPDLQAQHLLAANEKPAIDTYELLVQLWELHLIDDAVRGGGLGPLLKHYLQKLLGVRYLRGAVTILLQLNEVLKEKHNEALVVTLVTDGVLQAAADYCLGLIRCQKVEGTEGMLLTSTVLLLRTVCAVLDDNASTGLLTTFSSLLQGVPTLKACTRMGDSHGLKDFAVSVPQGPWVARYKSESAWTEVCSKLLPALLEACTALVSGCQQKQQQNGIFRDVAISAWTCCNPGCTNMAGQQEASLALSKCAGCGEVRYCSKHCQRQDWRRHKPICQAIRQLK